ncbi:MAG TPA: glyoxalase, partial [Roseiflexaceae bacterium]|nr:glyoxalase [Roseiflexaceae bacterium]
MELVGFDHLQLAIPPGGEEAARAFYGVLLGMTELPKPAALAARGGCWFAAPGVQLHMGVETPFAPARKAHPAFLVDDLDAWRAAMEAA